MGKAELAFDPRILLNYRTMWFCTRALLGIFIIACLLETAVATRRADDQYFSGKVVVEGEGRISSLRFGADESLRLYKKIVGNLDTLKLEGAMHLQGYYLRLDTGPDSDAYFYETGIDVPFEEGSTFEFFNSEGANITLLVNGAEVLTAGNVGDLAGFDCLEASSLCPNTLITVQNGGTGASTPQGARDSLELGDLATKDCLSSNDFCSTDFVMPIQNGGTGASTADGARDNLGLGDLATKDLVSCGDVDFGACPLSVENGGTGATTDGEARTNLGLGRIATLDCVEYMDVCGLIPVEKGGTGADNEGDARVNLGLGRVAVLDCVADLDVCGAISVEKGGTGATTAEEARTNLGFGKLSVLDGVSNENWIGMPLMLDNGGTGATSAGEARINLGLGKLSVLDGVSNENWIGMPLMLDNGGTGATTAEEARTNLGLGKLAVLDGISDENWIGMPLMIMNGGTGASTAEEARLNLGLGSLAVLDGISDENWIGTPLSIENGGTGASSAEEARLNLGLGDLATRDNVGVEDILGDLCWERARPNDFAMKVENSHLPSNFEENGYDGVSGLLISLTHVTEPTRQNEFVRFVGEGTTFGAIRGASITGNSGGVQGGVEYTSSSRDFAEWLPRLNKQEAIEAGEVVGVTSDGKVTKNLESALYVQVVSTAPIVLGNTPHQAQEADFEKIAMLGQVPVKVRGAVQAGDCILPSGLNDGFGMGKPCSDVTSDELSEVIGTAWESSYTTEGTVNVAIGLLDSRLVAAKTASLDAAVERLSVENKNLKEKMQALEEKLENLLLALH